MWMMRFLLLVVVIPIMFYIYRFLRRVCETFGVNIEIKAVKAVLVIVSVGIGLACTNVASFGTIIVLHVLLMAWIVQFINFLVKKIAKEKFNEGFHIWKKIYGSGVIPVLLSALILTYGYVNMHNVVETNYTIYTQKDIREEGYRVALLSDVHFGVSIDYEELVDKCKEISENDIDIVVLCGDIVDDSTSREDMESVFEALSKIKNKYGIFYVYGNHDRQLYREDRAYREEELANVIEGNGITILQDETFKINDDLVLVGREDKSYERTSENKSERLSIEELLKNVDGDSFILTLDHQPREYVENGKAGTDLLLSGHTHGGQIWPANLVSEIAKINDAVYGFTQINDESEAIVTSGVAGWSYPVKTAGVSEYVIIDIKNKNN